jgi:vancomycin resistance protein YoaR
MTRAMTAEPLTSPAIDEPSVRLVHPHRLRTRFLAAFVIGLLAVLGVGVGALYAYDQQYHDRILPGVHVGAVDVSGLTPEEASTRLHAAFDGFGNGRVVLVAGDERLAIPYAQIHREAAVDSMVERAMAVGRGGNPVERAIANARTAFNGVVIAPQVRYNENVLTALVNTLAGAQHQSPENATITLTKSGFSVTDSVTGRSADPEPVLASLSERLARIDAPAEIAVDLQFQSLEPTITTAEARDAVSAADRIAQNVTIRAGTDHWTITAATIRSWISFQPAADGSFGPVVDSTQIDKALKPVAAAVARSPRNASFTTSGARVVGVVPSVNGRALDRKATTARVDGVLASRAGAGTSGDVQAVVTVTAPSLTTAEAEAVAPKMRPISTWTTYFFITERNHFGANIWIPALDIDGQVVAPGETFDWWKAVGPITRARGYGDGGAIINGKTEPQGALAGGICSCSTTLFNAALRAGMDMGARRNHFYYIDRYPVGLDATVFKSSSGSTQTMSWTNDTKYPVLIRGYKIRANGKGYVRFTIYSVPNGRTVSISDPTIRNVRQATDTVAYTTTLAPGVRKRIEFPVNGMNVWRTVTVRENGRIIHQTTYYSHYATITGLTLIGRDPTTATTGG